MGESNILKYVIIILALIIFTAGLMVFMIMKTRRQAQKEMAAVLQTLDDALNGFIHEYPYDESMNSAIAERLNKLIQSSGMQKSRALAERDIIKSLISDISHQVRTPLTNILLYAELLKESNLAPDAAELAEKIQMQSEKLNFYMKELLKSSYAETDLIVVIPVSSPVDQLLAGACQAIEVEALKKNIVIRREETDARCIFDPKWTLEAVTNILENAVKYSPEASTVELSVVPTEAFTCIQIADQGIGIREEEQGRIFQRFYRSADVKTEPGFGIGLYLAREILSRQSGYIKVRSEPDQGSVFCIFLPNF